MLAAPRTPDGAYLYLELHPCQRCGSGEAAWRSEPLPTGPSAGRRYHAACGRCGTAREYAFAEPAPAAADRCRTSLDGVHFGGPEPSRLIDPGEWLLVADRCGRGGALDRLA